ncbi:MAG: hypothetical protein H6673_06260 [Anaerolineales bacterium]|nr:hypothetical protein [Anaerolineales bacterium]
MSSLRQVLTLFEENRIPLTIEQVARNLDLDRGMAEGMVTFWVQKGKLRLRTVGCHTCGGNSGCPFMPKLADMYELTRIPVGACQNKNTG